MCAAVTDHSAAHPHFYCDSSFVCVSICVQDLLNLSPPQICANEESTLCWQTQLSTFTVSSGADILFSADQFRDFRLFCFSNFHSQW